jgi:hypothetical protein
MARRAAGQYDRPVIYCVVPEPLADELFDKLTAYYAADPNVTVIVDRRKATRREDAAAAGGSRTLRDRRRPRVPGELPPMAGG